MHPASALRRSAARRHASSPAAFEAFVATSAERLLRTGFLLTGDLAEAEDVVQETLLRVARRWPRVASMERPHAYARRVLVNLVIDGAEKRSRRRAELESGGPPEGLDRGPDGAADHPELLDALRRLPPRQLATLVLRYFEDLSEAETASALGCTTGTVKSTTFRALERLRAELAERPTPEHDPAAPGRRPEGSPTR